MTKYILHGGETGIENKHNQAFYQEWVKDFKDDFIPTILLVYFSRPEEGLEYLEKSDKERFNNYTNNYLVNFIVANSDLNIFKEQIKEADVIYIRGGSTNKLMDVLYPIKDNFLDMLKDKTCAGSSAGVMVFSHATRSNKSDWKEGFGLLPINSIVHWSEDLRESFVNYQRENKENKYEYLLIPETEFIVKNF